MSITLSGLIFGLCLGRVFAGVLAYAASWRDTYWLAVGVQSGAHAIEVLLGRLLMAAMWGVLWLSLPDTPQRNPGISYFEVVRCPIGESR